MEDLTALAVCVAWEMTVEAGLDLDFETGAVLEETDLAPGEVLGDVFDLDLVVPDFLTDFFATDATKPFCCRVGPS